MSDAINEIKLLKNCLKGHTEGFDLLVGRYQSLVCAITYSATGDVEKSEELAQETFLLAWKNLGQLKDLAKFKAWLCTIARRVIQNWARARQRDVVSKAAPLEAASSQSAPIRLPVEAAIQREQQAVVNQALKQLPEQFRVPLILYYREDKSTREVATLIGLNENATRQRIARARGLLKNQVAAMVETTLAQSKPGKAFTAGVLASLAGVSIEGVATVTAAGVAATGLSSLTLKIVGIAAGLLLITGVTLVLQKPDSPDPTPPQPQTQGIAVEPNRSMSPNSTLTGNSIQPESAIQEIPQIDPTASRAAAPPEPRSPDVTPSYEFSPRGVLSGLITDAETGDPVRDARIYIASNGMKGVRTDKHGFYHIDKLRNPGTSTVFIDSNDYVGFGMNANAPRLNFNQDQQLVKHFQLPRACKVEVRVVDTNGVGIAGVELIPTSLADNGIIEINDHGRSRRTDRNGYRLLGGFPPLPTDYMITAVAQGVVSKKSQGRGLFIIETRYTHCPGRAVFRLTDPQVTQRVTIVLERGETVHGYAEYQDKQPAVDIKIAAQPAWWHSSSTVDFVSPNPDGTFALSHILPGTYDISMAMLNSEGMPTTSRVISQRELPLDQGEPLLVQLPVSSPQGGASISGHLVVKGSETPGGVWVTATAPRVKNMTVHIPLISPIRKPVPFRLQGLKPGTYRLKFSGNRIGDLTLDDIVAPSDDLEVELHSLSHPRLEGFVLGELTEEPISQFQIRVRKLKTLRGANSMPSPKWITFHHPEGFFDIETAGPGIYQVQVLADGYAPNWSGPINTDENHSMLVSLSLGGTLKGRIIDQAGEPIDEAKVVPLSWAGDANPRTQHLFASEKGATRSTKGLFTLSHLPEGTESLKITHPDYALQTVEGIWVNSGRIAQVDDIVLRSGGIVEGFVLDEQDTPLANKTICFADATTGTTDDPSRRWATVVTDANGFYRASHLPTEDCYVYRNNLWKMRGVMRRLVIPKEGETIRLDFGGAFKVRGILEGQEGIISQRRMAIRELIPAHFECFTLTDESGYFCFSGIVPGTYNLVYEDPDSRQRWQNIASITILDEELDLGVVKEAEGSAQKSTNTLGIQTPPVSSAPQARRLGLKLPLLLQPPLHWTFISKADFLAGKLKLRIERGGKATELIIFEKGKLADGWQAMSMGENPKAGEIYFGFESSLQYLTTPEDTLELTLHVVKDLDGIGAMQTGVLPAGTYTAKGGYTLITDAWQVPEALKAMPEETVENFRKMYDFKAYLENLKPRWPLEITGDGGWLDPQRREQLERMLEQMKEEN